MMQLTNPDYYIKIGISKGEVVSISWDEQIWDLEKIEDAVTLEKTISKRIDGAKEFILQVKNET